MSKTNSMRLTINMPHAHRLSGLAKLHDVSPTKMMTILIEEAHQSTINQPVAQVEAKEIINGKTKAIN
ncbi:hypothetical protein [Vibrio coralliilyticus]|uniref:hypothetical protein n=1 Tax=Vibrio coralliilyticus TaxID=190893 RepID=UPI002FD61DD1